MTRFSDLLRQAADTYDMEQAATASSAPIPWTVDTSAATIGRLPPAAEKPGDPMVAQPADLPTIVDIKFRRTAGVGGFDWIRIAADGIKAGWNLAILRTDNPPNSETYPTGLEVAPDGTWATNANRLILRLGTYEARLVDPVSLHTGPWAPFTVS